MIRYSARYIMRGIFPVGHGHVPIVAAPWEYAQPRPTSVVAPLVLQ